MKSIESNKVEELPAKDPVRASLTLANGSLRDIQQLQKSECTVNLPALLLDNDKSAVQEASLFPLILTPQKPSIQSA